MRSVPLIPRGATGRCFVRWFASLRDYLWGIQSSPAWPSLSLSLSLLLPCNVLCVQYGLLCSCACVCGDERRRPPPRVRRPHAFHARTHAGPPSLSHSHLHSHLHERCAVLCCDVL